MTIGEHIALLRKRKKMSQAELGKQAGTSGDIIGRYERGNITPSIDVIIKIADILQVSIDFLVGKTSTELDINTQKIVEEISRLPENEKAFIIELINIILRDFRSRSTY